jgi:muramoyltetrapeptide carboxypeptidase
MKLAKVSALRPGDVIGLLSPAGAVKKEQVENALFFLERQGVTYRLGKHTFSDYGLTSAPLQQRIDDLLEFLKDPQVKVLWSLRGGYGSIQLLNKLDYALFKKYPKLLIGFSDITALQWGIFRQTGLPALSGLTLTTQVSEANPFVLKGLEILSGERIAITGNELLPDEAVVYRGGGATGILIGGTLSMICSLCGTPYWLNEDGIILYLEDVNEPLYRIDRYFQQLHLAGFWKQVRGIILGKFLYQEENLNVLPLLEPLLPPSVPVVYNFPYAHQVRCFPMPLGVSARLQTTPFQLSWTPFLA